MVVTTIPNSMSVLSVIGANNHQISDGDDYSTDGWVYDKNGSKIRKWFVRLDHNTKIWKAKLDNVTYLEDKYYKSIKKRDEAYDKVYEPIINKIKRAGEFGGILKFHNSPEGGYAAFNCHEHTLWKWVKNKPGIIRQDLVDEFAKANHYFMKRLNLGALYSIALDRAVGSKYAYTGKSILQLNINDRRYLYMDDGDKYKRLVDPFTVGIIEDTITKEEASE